MRVHTMDHSTSYARAHMHACTMNMPGTFKLMYVGFTASAKCGRALLIWNCCDSWPRMVENTEQINEHKTRNFFAIMI